MYCVRTQQGRRQADVTRKEEEMEGGNSPKIEKDGGPWSLAKVVSGRKRVVTRWRAGRRGEGWRRGGADREVSTRWRAGRRGGGRRRGGTDEEEARCVAWMTRRSSAAATWRGRAGAVASG
jgi:hypothetical protein